MDNEFSCSLHKQLCKFDIQKYAYLFFDKCPFVPPDIYGTLPEKWLNLYRMQRLYYTDPIIHFARTTVKPFAWSSITPYLSNDALDFLKLAKRYGLTDGYTFFINDALGNSAFLHLSCDDNDIDIAFYEKNRDKLQMILIDIYDLYLNQKKHTESYRHKAYLMFSNQERKVLALGCAGLKYKEIATELGITERTIKFHMSKIINKLEVENAKQAFLKFQKLDII